MVRWYVSVKKLDIQEYLLIIKCLVVEIVGDTRKVEVKGNVVFKLAEYFRCQFSQFF